jgi:hypothetical protein
VIVPPQEPPFVTGSKGSFSVIAPTGIPTGISTKEECPGLGSRTVSIYGERRVTKAEAVTYLTNRGFHAFERDWAMGETIGVAADRTVGGGGITVYRYMVYLARRGEGWIVEQLNPLNTDPQQQAVSVITLEDACAQVEAILSEALGRS